MTVTTNNGPICVTLRPCRDDGVHRHGCFSVSWFCIHQPLICQSFNPIRDAARKLLADGASGDIKLIVLDGLNQKLLQAKLADAASGDGFDFSNVLRFRRKARVPKPGQI